jgi:PAS domain-containing protein
MSIPITYPTLPNISRAKEPGLQEIGVILNLIPEASLLLDRITNTILHVNSALLKMTAYSHDELCGESIERLIPESGIENAIPGNEQTFLMNRRNRNPIPMIAQANHVDLYNQWLILTLIPQQKQLSELQKQEKLFQGLLERRKWN